MNDNILDVLIFLDYHVQEGYTEAFFPKAFSDSEKEEIKLAVINERQWLEDEELEMYDVISNGEEGTLFSWGPHKKEYLSFFYDFI